MIANNLPEGQQKYIESLVESLTSVTQKLMNKIQEFRADFIDPNEKFIFDKHVIGSTLNL